jgi:hypothetical protein
VVSLEVNAEEIKYMFLPHHKNVGQNRFNKVVNTSFENMAQFKCLGMAVTNQNLMQQEIKRRLKLDNACYHSVQTLLFKNVKTRLCKTIILPVIQ